MPCGGLRSAGDAPERSHARWRGDPGGLASDLIARDPPLAFRPHDAYVAPAKCGADAVLLAPCGGLAFVSGATEPVPDPYAVAGAGLHCVGDALPDVGGNFP